ncbi:MAG: hypothetical protein SH848_08485 [Saprospiraceae bacterium]|nr:hypothetical protein [Saprospiraceae bacterium]MDZ4703952.1 hypothetical protein [Saprospiraceae bacterium]
MKVPLFAIVLLFLFTRCTAPETQISPAFYHWRTRLALSQTERNYLHELNIKKLYAKFFDVDWSESSQQALPQALIELVPETLPDSVALIPTIFITNRTFLNLPASEILQLAASICDKIKALAKAPFDEVQLDCDWSEKTRAPYFQLIETMRQNLGPDVRLSATIRLHQVKYPKQTGVPPVDRGMLMFYNMGDVEAGEEHNSILNLEIAQQYLDKNTAQYPIPLDVALPLFSWGVLFREGKMIRLINNLTAADLARDERLRATGSNRFEVVRSGYVDGYYLYTEDEIRIEAVQTENLMAAAELLKRYLPKTAQRNLAFYHLDSVLLERFSLQSINSIIKEMK